MLKVLTQFIDIIDKLKMVSFDFIRSFPTESKELTYILVMFKNFHKTF